VGGGSRVGDGSVLPEGMRPWRKCMRRSYSIAGLAACLQRQSDVRILSLRTVHIRCVPADHRPGISLSLTYLKPRCQTGCL
jgi:hypothetical protein